jgi:hypothetical protein
MDRQAKPAGSVENDPNRRFATTNCRIAKGSFAFDVGRPVQSAIR